MNINDWPAKNVEIKGIETLLPYAQNARTHSEEQIQQIAKSMQEWGWTNPVLIDENQMIIAGHGRIMAAQSLGYIEAPVMVAKGWTEAQKKAYVLADNQLAINAGWDDDVLSSEIKQLDSIDFDIGLIGFDELEVVSFLVDKTEGLTDPDEVPPVPDTPTTVLGDIWVLGNHRIVCGDSTDADTVHAVLDGAKPHLMVTDPPYGVEYDANWRNERGSLNTDGSRSVGKGGRAIGKVENDNIADWSAAYKLFEGDVAYVWHASLKGPEFAASLDISGFELRSQIVWDKTRLAIGRSDYHWQHEPCWYAVRRGKTGHWNGDRKQVSVWAIKHQKSETGHSTQKPIECMKRPIENNSKPGDAVYEPFSGSGTTIIAGEMTGRKIYAIELSPEYVDIAVTRWEQFTGNQAIQAETGQTFAQMAAERVKAA